MTTDDEHHRQQRSRDNHHGDSSEDQESNVVYSDRHDNRTAAAVIDNTVERPNIMDLQTTIGREDLPQMLQRFLRYTCYYTFSRHILTSIHDTVSLIQITGRFVVLFHAQICIHP